MLSYSFLINDFNQMQCRKKIKSNQILYKNKYYSIYATLYNSTHNLVLSFLTPS